MEKTPWKLDEVIEVVATHNGTIAGTEATNLKLKICVQFLRCVALAIRSVCPWTSRCPSV